MSFTYAEPVGWVKPTVQYMAVEICLYSEGLIKSWCVRQGPQTQHE